MQEKQKIHFVPTIVTADRENKIAVVEEGDFDFI